MTVKQRNAAAAAAYYDAADIADFYRLLWGGEDIHIGRYDRGDETVAEASAAMTRHLLDIAGIGAGIRAGDRVLDIACGYGGTLRLLAQRGCRPRGIDISTVCVERAREANRAAGLAGRITVERAISTPSKVPTGPGTRCCAKSPSSIPTTAPASSPKPVACCGPAGFLPSRTS